MRIVLYRPKECYEAMSQSSSRSFLVLWKLQALARASAYHNLITMKEKKDHATTESIPAF